MPREREIQRAVITLLRERGAYVVNIHGSAFTTAGTPDLLASYRGRFLGIECKQPGKSPTEIQRHRIDQIRKAGGFAFTVRETDDLLDAIEMIDGEIDRQILRAGREP